ncbi:MAG TPA: hypothetical protein VK034_10665 [Enhygromyxa sp.]|nr:hypothetical protein [Enhygromyxa sp.]
MQFHSAVLAALLSAPAPVGADDQQALRGDDQQALREDYQQALREIEALSEAINAGEPVRDALFDALAAVTRHAPLLAEDSQARAIRTRAQLNLARTYLSDGASASAAGVMDEILRSTIGEQLPVDEFGPSLVALHAERLAALTDAGTASIELRCRVPCRAYVNERAVGRRVDGLYLGIYRVWIEAVDERGSQLDWVRLSEPNQTRVVEFRGSLSVPAEAAPPPARVLPRAAQIALLAIGGGLATAGGLLLGHAGDDPDRTIVGATLTGLGGAALLFGGVTLGVDEIRIGKAHGRQAMLIWQMNF